ncbi:hypothetical protein KO528_14245 [Saccharophagus degradans]|uniref:Uncharacterized protein n=1 Tax=Saccharophagus degradans TaxID=86304 RepID=A0AAW7XA04_9GAMM|nr:hypothetical protein [Saccharophagus degradans]MBU2986520.1 hypothetical protein [Saccharophagus degradans]MDO6424710.1 hypothetical protein [Saccharophagus degradans]MDO6609538.1 hypothetical protein [Saccharophagus degradans]
MPRQFTFTRENAEVRKALSPEQLAAVRQWQNERLDYQFEFHTQHMAGWPCYLREPDGPNRNLPKVNLKEYIGQLLQGSSVRTQANVNDFEAVIAANIDAFKAMAELFYEGEEVATSTEPTWHVEFACNRDKKAKTVFIRLPSRAKALGATFWDNMKSRAEKPNCPLHRNARCLDDTAVQLEPAEARKVTKYYNDNSEIVG